MQSRLTSKSQNEKTSTNQNGEWKDISCEVGNYFVCEKLQYWSVPKIQKTLLNARRELRESLDSALEKIVSLEKNPSKNQ